LHLEILVEERSAEVALRALVPKIVEGRATFEVRVHQGKPDLLQRLPNRLRGYRACLPEDHRIVVLVDEDRQDCLALKGQLQGVWLYGSEPKSIP